MPCNVGDWVVCDLKVGLFKEISEGGAARFSDGFFETSGIHLRERFRPLTLRSKRVVETFGIFYKRLGAIDGNGGFNYPRIVDYFSALALEAIDGDEKDQAPYEKALAFIQAARNYTPIIDGVPLFQRAA